MLFTLLQPFFEQNGFQSAEASGIFYLRQSEATLIAMIAETQHPEGQVVELQLGIRHQMVEEIVYPFALGLQSADESAHTLLVSQGQIEMDTDRKEWLRDEADVVLVARQWQSWMAEKGFVWLDIHRQAVWLDQIYNDDPERARRWQPDAFPRSLRAIALAYICQRLDFRSVVQRGKRDLAQAEAAPELLLRLDALVSALP